ncbi:MAG: dipeptide ABC transporter ATP-binding protein [Mycobacteriaceae bacterium]
MSPVLSVRDLNVDFWVDGTWYPAATDISFDLHEKEVLAVVGESGSGKSTTAMALLGLLPSNARISGSIKIGDNQILGANTKTLRSVRGNDVAVIFQEPMTALNPVYSIGFQISEAIRSHRNVSSSEAKERVLELLKLVELPEPEKRINYYPHQLSGGQRQRAMIAQALACDPKILIADEPTTALDVTVQAEILELLRSLKKRINTSIVLITHDMGVVADMADRVLVMKSGRVIESGTAEKVFYTAQQEYTQQLLEAVPHLGSYREQSVRSFPPQSDTAVLEFCNVSIEYPSPGRLPNFRAVQEFSLAIAEGEVVGVVGESGSGKSTIGRAIVGLVPIARGQLLVNGIDISTVKPRDLRLLRSNVGMVFQDPGSSLNPRWPIGQSIAEPLLLHHKLSGTQRRDKVGELLDQVQLPKNMQNRYPHELSGGQRQRVGIARALALEPRILIADEPTSALDVSVQSAVLGLFRELQQEHGFACIFISHDLAVVEMLADRIAVMSKGKLVEVGQRDHLLSHPEHGYTQRLLAAVPVPDPREQRIRREERMALLKG